MKILKFGLRHKATGKFCGFKAGKTCVLEAGAENVWIIGSKDQAEHVRKVKISKSESSCLTPLHSYDPEELETVKVFIGVWDENKE